MPTVRLWQNVQIAIQSALASAVTLSGITKANPGVLSWASGTDPVNGDYLYLSSIQGMNQMDEKVVRAANVNGAGNTAEAEGVDTTLYNTFSSGQFQVITFGTSLSIALEFSGSGGDFEQIDVTTVHDLVRKQIPGAANPIVYNGTCIWDPADAGFAALKAASDAKAKRAMRITFADGAKAVFTGYIGFTGIPVGQNQNRVETPLTITMFGTPTFYAS
jgi:hypothetical protein